MSIKVTSWALNEAPVDDPVLVLVLVAMAERANDDGTATYQSVETIARKARVSVRTCHRKLKELESAGLIRRGNQEFTAHLKAGHRPVVYDLAVHLNRSANLAGVPNRAGAVCQNGTSGVPPLADESSLESSNESSVLFQQPTVVSHPKKQKTTVPDKFVVTAELETWARGNAPSVTGMLEFETKKFLAHNGAKGTTYIDWTLAWKNWMLKAHEWAAQAARGQAQRPQAAPQDNGMRLGWNYGADNGHTASHSTR